MSAQQKPRQNLINLKEALTCSLCREVFKEPKTLSCLHSFCEKCLSDHIQKRPLDQKSEVEDTRKRVPCPSSMCRHVEVLEQADVNEVKTNLAFKNMVEYLMLEERVRGGCDGSQLGSSVVKCDMCEEDEAVAFCSDCNKYLCEDCWKPHKKQKDTKSHKVVPLEGLSPGSGDEAPLATHKTWMCEKHGDTADALREVVLYCKQCDEMICMLCGNVEPHGNHQKFEAEKIIDDVEYKPQIVQREQKVADVQGKFSKFISEMKELQQRLKEHQTAVKRKIEKRLQEIQAQLEKDKVELVAKADRIFEAKNKRLQDQIEELEAVEGILKDSRRRVNDTLTMGIPSEILFNMTRFIKQMKSLFDEYDEYDRTPRENDILQFSANTEFDLRGAIGTVAADPFPEAFTLDNLDNIHFIQGKKATVTVTCRDIAGTPRPIKHDIKVELCPPANGTTLQGRVEKDVNNGTYTVTLQPNTHGEHELRVSVTVGKKDIPIKGSPFKVRVSRPLLGEVKAENITIAGLQHPWGIAVWRGKNLEGPGEGGDRGEDGGVGDGGVRDDAGVEGEDAGARNAQNSDIVAITDIGTHHLLIVTNGDFQNPKWIGKEGGGEGEGNLEFNSPRGVAFNPNGEVVVVDKDNSRVQVLSAEGTFKFKFGERGSGNGEFRRPTDVVIDTRGTMYISDTDNNRIQYFKPDGEYLGQFGGPGTFSEPYALTCNELGWIFITERQGNQIQCWVSQPPNTGGSDNSSVESSQNEASFNMFFTSDILSNELLGITHHPQTGYIAVTEMKKHRVSILDKKGHILGTLGKEGKRDNEFLAPMGVGFMGDAHLIICDCGKKKIMLFPIVEQ